MTLHYGYFDGYTCTVYILHLFFFTTYCTFTKLKYCRVSFIKVLLPYLFQNELKLLNIYGYRMHDHSYTRFKKEIENKSSLTMKNKL